MPAIIPEEIKHKVGRPSSNADFYVHKCKGSLLGLVDGKELRNPPNAKIIYKSIGWKWEEMPLNIRGSDACGICGSHVEDNDEEWTKATEEQVKCLQSNDPKVE